MFYSCFNESNNRSKLHGLSISAFSVLFVLQNVRRSLKLIPKDSRHKVGNTLDRVQGKTSLTHYRQFRGSSQPTMHVIGPGE